MPASADSAVPRSLRLSRAGGAFEVKCSAMDVSKVKESKATRVRPIDYR